MTQEPLPMELEDMDDPESFDLDDWWAVLCPTLIEGDIVYYALSIYGENLAQTGHLVPIKSDVKNGWLADYDLIAFLVDGWRPWPETDEIIAWVKHRPEDTTDIAIVCTSLTEEGSIASWMGNSTENGEPIKDIDPIACARATEAG